MVASVTALSRGGIYLARLDPVKGAEAGKLRPVLILSAQELLDAMPPIVFICPLSSRSDPAYEALHVALPPRAQLERPSWALVEHCRAISTRRLRPHQLATADPQETKEVLRRLGRMLTIDLV